MRKSLLAVWRDVVRDSDLGYAAKLVGLVLSTYMDARGRAWPSRETLARGASRSLRLVHDAIGELEGAGYVEIERSRGRSSHTYRATLPATVQGVHRSEWATVQTVHPNGADCASNGAQSAPESAESAESGALSRGVRLDGDAAQRVCEECGVAGRHAADCSEGAA